MQQPQKQQPLGEMFDPAGAGSIQHGRPDQPQPGIKSAAQPPTKPPMEGPHGGGGAFWRPILIGNRMRATSEDSADDWDAFPAPANIFDDVDYETRHERKMSLSEMFLGRTGGMGRRMSAADSVDDGERKGSITEHPSLKELLARQRHLVEDK